MPHTQRIIRLAAITCIHVSDVGTPLSVLRTHSSSAFRYAVYTTYSLIALPSFDFVHHCLSPFML